MTSLPDGLLNGGPLNCREFDDSVDELAVGTVNEPLRSRLLAHSAGCSNCQLRLDELSSVADRMLLLIPEYEPPAGFEARALSGFGAGPTALQVRQQAPMGRWSRHLVGALAAAAIVMGGIGGALFGRLVNHGERSGVVRHGFIETADGPRRVGEVRLVADPKPHVLVVIDRPTPGQDRASCALILTDGRVIDVGSWNYDEISSGVWAVGIAPELMAAVSMRVTRNGVVVATATIT